MFLNVLTERGFVHQCTDDAALDTLLLDQVVPAYIGFDCTAPSLHVGSLLQIMALRWLQKTGHKPIILMGGGTTKVGDPSGKDESRQLLDEAAINKNMDGIKTVFEKYIKFGDGPTDAIMVNNAEWLDGLNYIEFLRDYGRHFSVNRMMSMESVKLRLDREHHLSFLEFNYMILQAYDFVELNKNHSCRLQIGGSDQWGNIVNGIELQRRVEGQEVFGLTTPLITTSSGAKMGKTAQGAVWLNADMYSSYDYWQFWRNTEDADVGRFLRFFTELPTDEIERLENLEGAAINEAKIVLANEATKLCHGEDEANKAFDAAQKVFEQGGVSADLPTVEIPSSEFAAGFKAYELFVRAGLEDSNGKARKLIQQGGAKIDDEKVTDENAVISQPTESVKLSAGKKRHILVKAV
jgi:tyrosyl-tRNA synthetase